jgi:hypothetical protein
MRHAAVTHEFVDYIPDNLLEGTVYVSIRFSTVVHKCRCGCGNEVVTPLSPTDWTLIFDGQSISLDPSIGNWSFNCQSHYWIKHNRVVWAPRWSRREIQAGRASDRLAKERYFDPSGAETASPEKVDTPEKSLWRKMKKWWA